MSELSRAEAALPVKRTTSLWPATVTRITRFFARTRKGMATASWSSSTYTTRSLGGSRLSFRFLTGKKGGVLTSS